MQQILNFIVCQIFLFRGVCQIFLFRGVGRRGKGFSFITQCVIYLEVIFAAKRYRFLSIKLFIQLLFFQSCKTSNYCIFLAGNPARYTLVLRHLILMSGTRAVRARVRRPDGGVDWGLLYGAWPGTLLPGRREENKGKEFCHYWCGPWCDSSAIVHMLIIFLRYKHCFLRKLNKNLHLILDNDFHTSIFFSPNFFLLELFFSLNRSETSKFTNKDFTLKILLLVLWCRL